MNMVCSGKEKEKKKRNRRKTFTQNIMTCRVRVPVVCSFTAGILVVCTRASEQTQNAEDVFDTMLFRCQQRFKLLATVTRLFSSKSDSSEEEWVHNPPACIGYRGFVSAVGPDPSIGASR